jgi:hypothetical protein
MYVLHLRVLQERKLLPLSVTMGIQMPYSPTTFEPIPSFRIVDHDRKEILRRSLKGHVLGNAHITKVADDSEILFYL